VRQLARRRPGARLPQRRFAIGGLVIVAAVAYLIVTSFSSAVASVLSPGQLVSRGSAVYGQTVRLQGKVVGAQSLNRATLAHIFRVSDGHSTVVVSYASDLPGGFKTGAAVEAQGTFNGHVFTATSLTAKCPTKYQAATTSGH
jgi:cytochrome c-type biogenesis protein CcmE